MKRTETEFLLGLIAIVIVLLIIVWYLMTYGLPMHSNAGTYRVREYRTTTPVIERSSNSYNTTGVAGTSYQTQTVQTQTYETTTTEPGIIIYP